MMLAMPIPEKKYVDCDFIVDHGSATNSARDSARIGAKFEIKKYSIDVKI